MTSLAPQGLKVTEGQPYSTKKVDEDRNQIGAQYLRLGYLNANFRATVRHVGKDPHRLDVTYTISEGPKVILDSVSTLGAKVTRQSLIDRTVQLKSENPLQEDELLAAEGRLYSLGILDWAEIDPRRQITTQTDEDVLVKVHEARQNDIKYGFGFEVVNRGGSVPGGTVALPGLPPVGLPSNFETSQKTFWGPRGTFQYSRLNLRGLGETLTFSLLGARLLQRGSASYIDPSFVGSSWSSNLTLSGERNSENPIFTSQQGDFSFQLERALNIAKTKTFSLRYDYQQTALTNLLAPDLVSPEDRHVRLSTVSGTFSRDTRDQALDAHKGMYQTVELGINPIVLGSSVNFARLRAQQAYYKGVGKGIIWANSLRIGMEQEFAGSRVPVSELFFSGGGSTLRGFPLNGAGPQRSVTVCGNPADPSTCALIRVPTGGRELFILNSEFRIPVPLKKGLGVVAFYDGGNVFQHVGFSDFGSNYTNTLGNRITLRHSDWTRPYRSGAQLQRIKRNQINPTLYHPGAGILNALPQPPFNNYIRLAGASTSSELTPSGSRWKRIASWITAGFGVSLSGGHDRASRCFCTASGSMFTCCELRSKKPVKRWAAAWSCRDFDLHLSGLSPTVDLYGVVVHGAAPYSHPPLLEAESMHLGVTITSLLHKAWYVGDVRIEHPVARIFADKNGHTNLPVPKRNHSTAESQTSVFDLGIRHLLLERGEIYYNNRKSDLSADLHDLSLQSSFALLTKSYSGTLSYRDGHLQLQNANPIAHNFIASFVATPQEFRDGERYSEHSQLTPLGCSHTPELFAASGARHLRGPHRWRRSSPGPQKCFTAGWNGPIVRAPWITTASHLSRCWQQSRPTERCAAPR